MGGMRWAGLGKYMARSGAEIHVVASGPRDATDHVASGVVVHRCVRRRTLNDLYRAAVSGHRPQTPRKPAGHNPGNAEGGRGLFTVLRGELSWLLAFPDEGRGWLLNALRTALPLARQRGTTAVVSSGPPHTVHLIGALIAAWRRLPHVVDLRDPWGTHRYDPKIWSRGIHAYHVGRFALPLLERLVFRRASVVVANTRRLQELLTSRYPKTRIEWIPNGVDLEGVSSADGRPPFPGLSIAYAGTLYGGRALGAVMRAFAEFLDRHPEARDAGSRIRVAGHMEEEHAEVFLAQRRQLGLDDSVEHVGMLPRREALDLARASSVSLVLAQAQELQVPGKIYELAALGGPVLVLSEKESASADEALRLGLQWAEPDDHEALLGILEALWSGKSARRPELVAQIGYDAIAHDMEDVIGHAVSPGRRSAGVLPGTHMVPDGDSHDTD